MSENGTNGATDESVELWRHPHPESTEIWAFQQHIVQKYGLKISSYNDLWQWSVDHPSDFWEEIWHYTGIKANKPYTSAFDESAPMFPKPVFFPGCELNFAENLLFPTCNPAPDSLAIIAATETTREHVTWAELRERVRVCATAMEAHGLKEGERVAGYLGNHVNTVIAMLAATSLGAMWTGVSPDTGVHAVLDRLSQVEPVLLFADNAVRYNGKKHETHAKISQVASDLPSVKNVVIFETVVLGHKFDLEGLKTTKTPEL